MKLNIYVNYKETCREAFQFYEKNLGGRIMSMATFGETPHAGDIHLLPKPYLCRYILFVYRGHSYQIELPCAG